MDNKNIKEIVRKSYSEVAVTGKSCCGSVLGCCGSDLSLQVGYGEADLAAAPEGANLGLGCGNPTALASLCKGETVLDLGSGAGFDAFLAARRVGPEGRVIGVDMTPAMVAKAHENAAKTGFTNVDFRLGDIECLPVDNASVDVVISNCVINLAPDKAAVFREAFRVLKPGGRLLVSDILLTAELPDAARRSLSAYVGCLSGAIRKEEYLSDLRAAGFQEVGIVAERSAGELVDSSSPVFQAMVRETGISQKEAAQLRDSVISAEISARKLG